MQTRKLQERVTKIGPPDKIVEQYPQEEFLLRLKLYIPSTIKSQMNLACIFVVFGQIATSGQYCFILSVIFWVEE